MISTDLMRDAMGYLADEGAPLVDVMGYYAGPTYGALPPANSPALDPLSAELAHLTPQVPLWQPLHHDISMDAPAVAYVPPWDVNPRIGAPQTAYAHQVAEDAPQQYYSIPPETSILVQYVSGPNYSASLLTASAPALSYGTLPGVV